MESGQDRSEQLLDLEHSIMTAIQRKDRPALERLVAPEFVLRTPAGEDVPRDRFVEMIAAIPGSIESIRGVEVKATSFGDVGVVTGVQEATVRLDEAGTVATSRTAFTDVFRLRDGAWRLVLAHSVELPSGRD